MRLQLAIDEVDTSGALRLLDAVADLVDIIEIGTPLVLLDGAKAVAAVRAAYPDHTLLADFKIVDAGRREAAIAFEAGADVVTVLAGAHDATVAAAVEQARRSGRQVMADLIAVEDVQARAGALDALGVDYVCVHTAFDVQAAGRDPLAELESVRPAVRRAAVAVAGGITPDTLDRLRPYQPAIVIVGGFIARHPEPRRAALEIRERLA